MNQIKRKEKIETDKHILIKKSMFIGVRHNRTESGDWFIVDRFKIEGI